MIKLYCDKCGKELKWNQGAKQRIKDCYDEDGKKQIDYEEKDVKEFIQKLKQIIDSFGENRGEGNGLISIRIGDDFTTNSIVMFKEKLEKIIRKLAGDKLTEKST